MRDDASGWVQYNMKQFCRWTTEFLTSENRQFCQQKGGRGVLGRLLKILLTRDNEEPLRASRMAFPVSRRAAVRTPHYIRRPLWGPRPAGPSKPGPAPASHVMCGAFDSETDLHQKDTGRYRHSDRIAQTRFT